MSTSLEFIQFVYEQISRCGDIYYKKTRYFEGDHGYAESGFPYEKSKKVEGNYEIYK